MKRSKTSCLLELPKQLPEVDRVFLAQCFSVRFDSIWINTVVENKRIAHERGITAKSIGHAIHGRRYDR